MGKTWGLLLVLSGNCYATSYLCSAVCETYQEKPSFVAHYKQVQAVADTAEHALISLGDKCKGTGKILSQGFRLRMVHGQSVIGPSDPTTIDASCLELP